MSDSLLQRVRSANTTLRAFLTQIREALAGRSSFDVTNVRAIAEPVSEMDKIMNEAKESREFDPALDREIRVYAGQLGEMNVELERMRFMLLARRAHIETMRGHIETLGLWSAALRLTR
jgi:hypothetical protein